LYSTCCDHEEMVRKYEACARVVMLEVSGDS
jgi:hypothetical protein